MPCNVEQPYNCHGPEKNDDCASNPIHRESTTPSSLALERCVARIAHDIIIYELDRNPEPEWQENKVIQYPKHGDEVRNQVPR